MKIATSVSIDAVCSLIAAILMGVVGVRTSYLTIKDTIRPLLSTWLLFTTATTLSLVTYLFSAKPRLTGNILNVMDVLMCGAIATTIATRGRGITFSYLERLCMGSSALILLFWIGTAQHFRANLLLQGVITVAYLPTIARLYSARTNPESLLMWTLTGIATLSGLAASLVNRDKWGIIYGARGLFFVCMILILIVRLERKDVPQG